jgi:hypothetical protein
MASFLIDADLSIFLDKSGTRFLKSAHDFVLNVFRLCTFWVIGRFQIKAGVFLFNKIRIKVFFSLAASQGIIFACKTLQKLKKFDQSLFPKEKRKF